MAGIAVVISPSSKLHRTYPDALSRFGDILGNHGFVGMAGDFATADRFAERCRREGVDVVAIGGGDGTSGITITAFRRVYGTAPLPRFAFIRGGTLNTAARSIGLRRGRPHQLLKRLVHLHQRGRALATVERATMDANGQCGFLFGVGTLSPFLEEYYARGNPHPTPWTAARTLAECAASSLVQGELIKRIQKRFYGTVTVDGQRWPVEDFLGVTAGTVREIGLGFTPFYRATERTDAYHLLGLMMTPADFVRNMMRIYMARPMPARLVRDTLARETIIETEEKILPYMLDGDLRETESPLILRMGPRVQLVVSHAN